MAAPTDRVTLANVALELGGVSAGVRVRGDGSTPIGDVQQDSRRISPGDLFVARLGSSTTDRLAQFTRDAIARGASAVMRATERATDELAVPTLEVPEARLRSAIGVAASAVHRHPSFVVDVIAVTGTNGKTTTTSLVADALDRLAGRPDCAVIGTVGARFGDRVRDTAHTTPEGDELARLLAWARDLGATYLTMEASSHALTQGRLAGTRVRTAAFTNLTQDHLEYHGTMEAYFDAKRRLFDESHPGGAVINVDDPYGARLADSVRVPLVRVSCEASTRADVRATKASLDASGIRATVATPSGDVQLESPLLGRHNLANLLLSLGVLISLGLDPAKACEALGRTRAPRGRLELASDRGRDDVVVLVHYAHTPDALVRVLAALRPITRGRLLCVFGCGGDRDPTKRGPMGKAVVEGADLAIVTSDNPRTEDPRAIVDAIVAAIADRPRIEEGELSRATRGVHVEVDRAAAIARTIAHARKDDVILIAGKGHEDYQIVGTTKHPFDDVKEAQRALARRREAH